MLLPEVAVTYLLIFASALLLAAVTTPLARRVAIGMRMLDQPEARKLHRAPVPLLGGGAIYAAFIIAILLFSDRFALPQLFGILIGATGVSFLGIWDDRRRLRPLVKLVGQVAAALLLVFSGTQVQIFPYPALDYLASIIWVVGITNTLNLLDNMDGLSGGVAAVASAFFLLLALLNGQYLVASLSAALLGACLGFLRYNLNPATIFMGDGGSLFLGFVLAAVGIRLRFPGLPTSVTWMIPIMILGLPIFDTVLVVTSRLRRGLNPLTSPGRDHLSHRLVTLGLTQRQAVLALYLVCGALGVAALSLSLTSVLAAYILAGIVVIAALVALARLERVPYAKG